MKITILGAGSWGTTLANLVTGNVESVMMWEFRPDAVKTMQIDRENKEFLPGVAFPDNLFVTDDIHEALLDADVCINVIPSHAVRSTAGMLANGLPKDCLLVSASKGIEQNSLMRMSEVFADVWKDNYIPQNFTCLSGPSHAEEVSTGIPTSVVAASVDPEVGLKIQKLFSAERFRVYTTNDVIGVELGGSLKNVIALASGITSGLGFGDNTIGALLTRGLSEIRRLGEKMGGHPSTFTGLSGMGDLITTCCSRHSRNRHVGFEIGKGRKLVEILNEMKMVAEGVNTTRSSRALAVREGVEMPITQQVHKILFENADPLQATIELMTRTLKKED